MDRPSHVIYLIKAPVKRVHLLHAHLNQRRIFQLWDEVYHKIKLPVSMMISVPASAVHEQDKRKKQTVDKAKASHLSRQLQMRLQYARLKVEHGWQKQNLNEVENLYFHHSHQRGPKAFLGPSLITTVQQENSFDQSIFEFPQSSLSFISRTATSSTLTESNEPIAIDSPAGSNSGSLPGAPSEAPSSSAMDVVIPAPSQAEEATTYPMDVDQVQRHGSATPTNSTQSVSSSQVFDFSSLQQTRNPTPPSQTGSSYLPPDTQPSTSSFTVTNEGGELAPYSGNHYPVAKPPRPRTAKPKSTGKHTPSLSTKDIYNFSPSNLTYDSFWSSHTPQPNTSRAPRLSLPDTSVVGLPTAEDSRRVYSTIPTSSRGSSEGRNQQTSGGPPP